MLSLHNVFDDFKERGFIEQTTHEEEIRDLLNKESVTFYIGFDPTADSLHIGHFFQMIVMMRMQQAGHRPIALLGGGTAMVGDPSGRTDMRQLMTQETIGGYVDSFKKQMSPFIDFSEGKALMLNNADWLLPLNYVEFLRDIGRHFSVNRMLTYDCFKTRMEKGLSFLEFNYMLMQSYDFLELYRRHRCQIQFGGNDQWSNIISGVELIRKLENAPAYGMTFKLLVTSEGKKMGKTQAGAIWLDPAKTSPYEFFQYWRNVDDLSVANCLSLLTFLPMEEVRQLGGLKDQAINEAKEVLAYEVTKLIHGESEAIKAQQAAGALFSANKSASDDMPTTFIDESRLREGVDIVTLFTECGLVASKSEGRRLVAQGGAAVGDKPVSGIDQLVTIQDMDSGRILLRKGKKTFHQIKIRTTP
jgi:tyrosyl-tRNA synthetase